MSEATPSSPKSPRILVVDDERSVCGSIEKVLTRAGYHTSTALSVSTALEALQVSRDFDLIITDLMMPQVNGLELLKIARNTWPDIPVLVITGYASLASAVEATQLGATNYLAKPFTPDELQEAVEQALTRKPADLVDPARVGENNSYSEVAAATSEEYLGRSDLPIVRHWDEEPRTADTPTVLVVDDEVIVVNSARRILTRKGYRVEAAFTGREALQRIQKESYGLVLLDMRLPDLNGLELLSKIKHLRPDLPVLVVTGYASIDTAVEAIQRGAADYMAKPFTPDELHQLAARTLSPHAS